jgi:formate dehydrogenase iron-sulfur subunit
VTAALAESLLAEQQDLAAVERFARAHDAGVVGARWRDLVPLSQPGSGEQYAFEVDLDACTGCKACVTACHNLNGLDADETWRAVGVLIGGAEAAPALQTVTTACHHCEDPGCRNGCPVRAYEKDAVTGIVRHLDDQCIGCRYCEMMCPYEVPQYSPSRGIVRKCDMCHGRLAAGEAPACVQACPNEAIAIRIVPSAGAGAPGFLPGTPAAAHTLPTTRYRSARSLEAMRPADAERLRPQPLHLPLVTMLVLSQGAIGTFVALVLAGDVVSPAARRAVAIAALGVLMAGLSASMAHLGQPLKAWRVFLGLRTSWMSREILAFNAVAGAATGWVAALWLLPSTAPFLALPLVLAGVVAVHCSAMLYDATGRRFWCWRRSMGAFVGTAAMLGASALQCVAPSAGLGAVVLLVVLVAYAGDLELVARGSGDEDLRRSARLMRGPFRRVTVARLACAGAALVALPFAPLATLALLLAAELCGRVLFFGAVAPPRMPGSL